MSDQCKLLVFKSIHHYKYNIQCLIYSVNKLLSCENLLWTSDLVIKIQSNLSSLSEHASILRQFFFYNRCSPYSLVIIFYFDHVSVERLHSYTFVRFLISFTFVESTWMGTDLTNIKKYSFLTFV